MKRHCLGLLALALCALSPLPARAYIAAEPRARPAWDDGPEPGQVEPNESKEPEEDTESESEAPTNPFSDVSKGEFEPSLSRALSDPSASFCKAQASDPLADKSLCELSKAAVRQRCPGLEQACLIKPEQKRWKFPAWLGGIADVAYWAVLSLVLVFLLLAVRRVLGSAKLEPKAERAPNLPSPEPARAPRRSAEGDVARLLAQAEQAASSSHFEEALAALQAALIHALRISGKLHVSPALTNGDYLRALRPEPALYAPAREVFRAVEAVQFGGAAASLDLYRKLFQRVQPIVLHALSALALFFLCFSQSSCGQSFAGGFQSSAEGLGVFTRIMAEQHTTVRRRVRSLAEIEPEVTSILVVGEQPSEAWSKLLEFASAGGTLIVTGNSAELEKATQSKYVPDEYSGGLELAPGFEPARLELAAETRHALELPAPASAWDRTFALAHRRPYVAARRYGAGNLFLFGDAEFFSSASLSVGDNAYFVMSLLRAPGEVLELVGPWTGGGSKSTFASLFKAGLGVLLGQLALLALLFAWNGGVSFGTPRDPVAMRRRAFRDHVLALGANYRRARATRFALATYGSWLIERLRDRLSPQQPIGLIDLAGRIATRVGQPEAELVLLLSEVRDAQEDLAQAKPSSIDLTTLDKLESITLRAGGSK
jgi:hypothetical protein